MKFESKERCNHKYSKRTSSAWHFLFMIQSVFQSTCWDGVFFFFFFLFLLVLRRPQENAFFSRNGEK
jgi:hypothetical protein